MAENEILRSRHAFGNLVDVDAARAAGEIDAFDILFLDSATDPKIGWLDKNGELVLVQGKEYVTVVDELPATGETGKVYIVGEDGFFWNGEKYINLCKPTDVAELQSAIDALTAEMAKKANKEDVDAQIADAVTTAVDTANAYTDKMVEAAMNEHLTKKYEFVGTPAGTLVDYREDEIRVMCPADTVFTKQSVGAGGDANIYYGTLKTYTPNDDAVGYIEHLGGSSDSEILTDLKTDEYGRKYQPTWLALAKYDETTDTWTYYGASSTVEKYIGWDYQIDWYNADGVMIASDSIRINLSNEDCHYVIEPFYVANAIDVAKAYADEKIAAAIAVEVVEF